MGRLFMAWASNKTLAAITPKVSREYPSLVNPSDNCMVVAHRVSSPPATIK